LSSPPPNAANSKFRGREWRRFLLATVAITLLYLGVQTIWMFGASHLAHIGWTVNDPAKTYAAEAAAIAEKHGRAKQRLTRNLRAGPSNSVSNTAT
jgi:hypothetical protein